MKLYGVIRIAILWLALPAGTLAQGAAADAGAILEKTAQAYRQRKGMELRFTARIHSDKNGTAESFEGTIVMKDDKFVLTTPDMTTWYDGTTQWTYLPRTGEVNVSTPGWSDLLLLNPMTLLQGYRQAFNAEYIGQSTSANARTAHDVALIPKKKEDIEKIELQIEKNSSLPAKLVVVTRNGIRSVIHVDDLKDASPPDNLFAFPESSYPDAEIIALR